MCVYLFGLRFIVLRRTSVAIFQLGSHGNENKISLFVQA